MTFTPAIATGTTYFRIPIWSSETIKTANLRVIVFLGYSTASIHLKIVDIAIVILGRVVRYTNIAQ